MHKNSSPFQKTIFSTCLTLALTSVCHAEIYKWVDASGKTHFSENKDEAGTAKAEELKIKSKPVSASTSSMQSWQEREQEFKQRLVEQQNKQSYRSGASTQTKYAPSGNQAETDASRCDLARGISSGKLVRRNGVATDANDRLIAERDISTYCR